MTATAPHLIVIGGPNGAGKSTSAPVLLRDELAVSVFVNADDIARNLEEKTPAEAPIAAGRIMLKAIAAHSRNGIDFAFESTLASRSLVRILDQARERGYRSHLVFLWLKSPELAVARVQQRVRTGGHTVPEETIHRRYHRGIDNFFRVYRPLADHWRFYDNSDLSVPRLIALGSRGGRDEIIDGTTWRRARAGCRG